MHILKYLFIVQILFEFKNWLKVLIDSLDIDKVFSSTFTGLVSNIVCSMLRIFKYRGRANIDFTRKSLDRLRQE